MTSQYKVLLSTIIPPITKSNPTNELSLTNYLIVGVGAFIGVPLIVLVIQKCLKSKSAKRNVSKINTDDQDEAVDSTVKSHDADTKKYGGLYHYGNREHFYQQIDSDYQEIDHCVEKVNTSKGAKILDEFNDSTNSPPPNDSYLFPITGTQLDEAATCDAYVEPVRQDSYIKPENLEPYLDPIKIQTARKQSRKDHRHSYIEVVELGATKSTENHDNIHQSSSSYDDVMWERPTVSHESHEEQHNTYLDAVFS